MRDIGRMASSGDGSTMRSEDRMLLDETHHRVMNEIAAAIAAMRIAKTMEVGVVRDDLIEAAVGRLEGFGECCRLLSMISSGVVDLGDMLDRLCRALLRERPSNVPGHVLLDFSRVAIDHEVARRVCMVAYELITNSLKHAFSQKGSRLEVCLGESEGGVMLSVIDDGPGIKRRPVATSSSTNLGRGLISELVKRAGGSIDSETGPSGTAIRVFFPLLLSDEPF